MTVTKEALEVGITKDFELECGYGKPDPTKKVNKVMFTQVDTSLSIHRMEVHCNTTSGVNNAGQPPWCSGDHWSLTT